MPVRQPAWPRLTLKRARICAEPRCWLMPEILFASANEYHVPGKGAPVKSANISVAPALPRTAPLAVHVSGSNVERTEIVIVLVSVAPHLLAAAWKAISRC